MSLLCGGGGGGGDDVTQEEANAAKAVEKEARDNAAKNEAVQT